MPSSTSPAVGIPYAVLTGDLRQASYGSQHAGLVDFRRRVEQLQHQVLVFQVCRAVYQRWLETAVLAGTLELPGFTADPSAWWPCKWIPPRWEWIDPLKDRQAEKLAVDAGFKARADVVEAEGYDVEETDAGTFSVEDPDGITIGTGTVGVEFAGGGLTFTVADGATDLKAGEGFTITVAAGSGSYREYDPANTDGSQSAVAVLFAAVDAAAANRPGVAIVRDAEVNAAELSWFTGATANQKAAGLAQLALAGIIGR